MGVVGPTLHGSGNQLPVTVLRYGAGYDLIAHVTGQPMRPIVPRGTVPWTSLVPAPSQGAR
jgi:hypothetical protein